MKLVYFNDFNLGVLKGDAVVDVSDAVKDIPHTGPGDLMNRLIEHWDDYKSRHRRTDAHARQRNCGAARHRRLEPRLVAVPMLDQPVHQIARAGMRDVLDRGTDIDHGVALQHAHL